MIFIVMTACVGIAVSGALTEAARRLSRGSWWSIPLLVVYSAGLGAVIWFLPLGWLNGHLQEEQDPPCMTDTPRLFVDFIGFGIWIAILTPLFLGAVWLIGRRRRSS